MALKKLMCVVAVLGLILDVAADGWHWARREFLTFCCSRMKEIAMKIRGIWGLYPHPEIGR